MSVFVFSALRCSLPISGQSVLSEGGGEWEGFPHEHSRKRLIPGVSVWSRTVSAVSVSCGNVTDVFDIEFVELCVCVGLWWLEGSALSCWTCTAGRACSTSLGFCLCSGRTACGSICSKERVCTGYTNTNIRESCESLGSRHLTIWFWLVSVGLF